MASSFVRQTAGVCPLCQGMVHHIRHHCQRAHRVELGLQIPRRCTAPRCLVTAPRNFPLCPFTQTPSFDLFSPIRLAESYLGVVAKFPFVAVVDFANIGSSFVRRMGEFDPFAEQFVRQTRGLVFFVLEPRRTLKDSNSFMRGLCNHQRLLIIDVRGGKEAGDFALTDTVGRMTKTIFERSGKLFIVTEDAKLSNSLEEMYSGCNVISTQPDIGNLFFDIKHFAA